MGVIRQGILGGFSGKVGTVIGSSWKGIAYMRGRAISIRNPRTPAQLAQRQKFSLVQDFLKSVAPVLRTGFKNTSKQSPFNAAMAYNVKNAVSGTYPDQSLSYSQILLSRGTLTPVTDAAATSNGNEITVTWQPNNTGNATPSDKVYLVGCNETTGEAYFNMADSVTRTACTHTLTVPENWIGNKVACYVIVESEDGTTIANSLFAGEPNLTARA